MVIRINPMLGESIRGGGEDIFLAVSSFSLDFAGFVPIITYINA